MSVLDRIGSLRAEAEEAVAGAPSSAALEELRVRYLGRKAELPNLLRGVAQLPPEERGTVGKAANQARQALEGLIEQRAQELEAEELDTKLAEDRIDVTLPGEPPQPVGRLHLVTQTWREIEDVFLGLGFTSVEGPEIDLVPYNFDALNHAPPHPAPQPPPPPPPPRRARAATTPTRSTSRPTSSCAPTRRRCRSARWRRT